MDVAVALIIVFALLYIANFFVIGKSETNYENLQLVRIGSDMVNLLEFNDLLDSPNSEAISDYLDNNLPPQYSINLIGKGNPSCVFESGDTPPEKDTIVAGKEYFKTDSDYCILEYRIWLE